MMLYCQFYDDADGGCSSHTNHNILIIQCRKNLERKVKVEEEPRKERREENKRKRRRERKTWRDGKQNDEGTGMNVNCQLLEKIVCIYLFEICCHLND